MKRSMRFMRNLFRTRMGVSVLNRRFGRARRRGNRAFWRGFSILPLLLVLLILLQRRRRPEPGEYQIAATPTTSTRAVSEAETATKGTPAQVAPRAELRAKEEDNLTLIAGIGPKISQALKSAGIQTFAQLAKTEAGGLEEILRQAGVRVANPMYWPEQARLAARGEWQALESLQSQLRDRRNQ